MIELGGPLRAIFERLDLQPQDVRRLDIRPREVIAEVYKRRNGEKYIEDGEPATEARRYEFIYSEED